MPFFTFVMLPLITYTWLALLNYFSCNINPAFTFAVPCLYCTVFTEYDTKMNINCSDFLYEESLYRGPENKTFNLGNLLIKCRVSMMVKSKSNLFVIWKADEWNIKQR